MLSIYHLIIKILFKLTAKFYKHEWVEHTKNFFAVTIFSINGEIGIDISIDILASNVKKIRDNM